MADFLLYSIIYILGVSHLHNMASNIIHDILHIYHTLATPCNQRFVGYERGIRCATVSMRSSNARSRSGARPAADRQARRRTLRQTAA